MPMSTRRSGCATKGAARPAPRSPSPPGAPGPEVPVTAGLARIVELQCGHDYEPGTELNAQMSARYCIAAALQDGQVLPPQFLPEKLADPAIVARARALRLVHDPALDEIYPANFCGWVELATTDGPRRVHVNDPSGSTANPDRSAALRDKVRVLLAGLLPAGAIRDLEAATAALGRRRAGDLLAPLARKGA